MLRLEIGFLEFNLMEPIFYARRGLPIPATSTGQFRSSFVGFKAFDVQEFNSMTLFQFHQSDIFRFYDFSGVRMVPSQGLSPLVIYENR
jgi:hypothetical protein